MARVVVLSFQDNEAAEKFVEKCDTVSDPEGLGTTNELGILLAAYAKIEAMVARPTAGCRCTTRNRQDKRNEGWSRTKRFGWFVHAKCKRPSSLVVQNFIHNMIIASGNDLLPELREKLHAVEDGPAAPTGGNDPVRPTHSTDIPAVPGSDTTKPS